MFAVLCVDGVLSSGTLPQAPSTLYGHSLYRAFGDTSWALLSQHANPEQLREWLLREGFLTWVQLRTADESLLEDPLEWKVEVIRTLISANNRPTFYVDADPESVLRVSALGVPSMLVVPPAPVDRYDSTYQPWETLVGVIDDRRLRQAELDQRRSRDE